MPICRPSMSTTNMLACLSMSYPFRKLSWPNQVSQLLGTSVTVTKDKHITVVVFIVEAEPIVASRAWWPLWWRFTMQMNYLVVEQDTWAQPMHLIWERLDGCHFE
mmetsp:Transcript_151620/g.264904  ORF Transcript_151620/g.264904 Transcript_151620/m.264904 type:complete len:105 (+) Transcript_151620:311-625(+)